MKRFSHNLTLALALCAGLSLPAGTAAAATGSGLLQARQGVSALLRGQYDKAIASYNEALEDRNLSDPRRANIYNDRGVAKWRLGQTREAVEDFNRAIELFPDYSVVYNNRGNALIDLGRPEEAIADFDRAITIAPAYGAAYNNRGNAYQLLGNLAAAESDYRKAAELLPRNAVPHNGLGKTHIARGRPFAAVREFNTAITLNAKYYSAHENRAKALGVLDRHDDAISDYTQVIAERPEDANLYLARGTTYANARKYNSAFRDFDKALKLEPELPGAYLQRAKVHLLLKRYDSAHEDAGKALELKPGMAAAFAIRAEAELRKGRTQEALADANRAIAYDEKEPEGYLIRAKIYGALNRKIEAAESYLSVLKLDPGNAEARQALIAAGKLDASAENAGTIGKPVKGWRVTKTREGAYQAVNARYPKVKVPLEMYGDGEPQIVDWNLLKYNLRGIGLLEYFAGNRSEDQKRLEYVAIVDLWKAKTVAVEPDSWGEASATWDWRQASVVVTDPAGNASTIQLRAARRDPSSADSDSPWYSDGGWQERARARQQRRRQSPPGGIFNWLFGN